MNFNTSTTQSGRVVVNATLDINDLISRKTIDLTTSSTLTKAYPHSSTEDHYLSVLPGEPLFMNSNSFQKKRKAIKDTHLELFSSFNGFVTKKGTSLDDLEKNICFAGFADTVSAFNSEKITTEDVVVQMGGVRTTRNSGIYNIRTGDLVYWKLPSPTNIKSNSKILAELRPVRLHANFSKKSLYERLTRNNADEDELVDLFNQVDTISAADDKKQSASDYAEHVEKLFNKVFYNEYGLIQSKIVGKALSDAKPNAEFDIVLGSYTI
jgi:hypothetical protein